MNIKEQRLMHRDNREMHTLSCSETEKSDCLIPNVAGTTQHVEDIEKGGEITEGFETDGLHTFLL